MFHFYLGSPARMLQLWPDGTGKEVVLGPDLAAGQVPQLVVPGDLSIQARMRQGDLWRHYERAGFRIGPPGCSMCLGVASRRAGPGEVWLSSQNRNYQNRMGPGSLAHLASVRQEDLRDTHLITFPAGYNLRTILEDWFHAAGCAPIVAAETGAVEVMLQLVATGVGVAILPRSLARRGLAMGMHCLSLEPHDSPRRVVAAVRRRSGRNAELVDAILPILEEHARDASRPAPPGGRPQD